MSAKKGKIFSKIKLNVDLYGGTREGKKANPLLILGLFSSFTHFV